MSVRSIYVLAVIACLLVSVFYSGQNVIFARYSVVIAGGDRTLSDTDGLPGETESFFVRLLGNSVPSRNIEWSLNGQFAGTGRAVVLRVPDGKNLIRVITTTIYGATESATAIIDVEGPNSDISNVTIAGGDRVLKDSDGSPGESFPFSLITGDDPDNPIELSSIEWRVNGVISGTAQSVVLQLDDGINDVQVTVVNAFGQAGSDRITVVVEEPDLGVGINLPPNYDLAYERIGYLNPNRGTISTCVRIMSNGIPRFILGASEFVVEFSVIDEQDGTIEINNYLPLEVSEIIRVGPDQQSCSGTLDISTGEYKDLIYVDEKVASATFFADSENFIEYNLLSFSIIQPDTIVQQRPGGVVPEANLGLPYNNIGVINESNNSITSCVSLFRNGVRASVDNLHTIEVDFVIESTEPVRISVSSIRPFNIANYADEFGAAYSCSGTFDLSDRVYEDTLRVGKDTYSAKFLFSYFSSEFDLTNLNLIE